MFVATLNEPRYGPSRRSHGVEAMRAVAYDLAGLDSVDGIRRLLVIAATDGLSLDPTVARVRAIVLIAAAAAKLLETGDVEERLAALEALIDHGRDAA